jgi:hypothetical protein
VRGPTKRGTTEGGGGVQEDGVWAGLGQNDMQNLNLIFFQTETTCSCSKGVKDLMRGTFFLIGTSLDSKWILN